MDIADFLTLERVAIGVRARDKAAVLTEAARLAAARLPSAPEAVIARALREREQLGSTGLGGGFALPHARIDGLGRLHGMFLRLGRPVEFDSIDGKPVDLVFLLLIPTEATDHVAALAAVSRRFRDPGTVSRLRQAASAAAAFECLMGH
jgi:PTS system nitrogen regulatory IIA component